MQQVALDGSYKTCCRDIACRVGTSMGYIAGCIRFDY